MKKKAIAGAAGVGALIFLPLVALVLISAIIASAAAVSQMVNLLGSEEDKASLSSACVDTTGASAVTGDANSYVRTMIGIAKTMGISERGQIIAVMVMLQESDLQNYGNSGKNLRSYNIGKGTSKSTREWLDMSMLSLSMPHDSVANDADSVGLYQQRASTGWADDEHYKAETATDGGKLAITRLLDPRWGSQAFFGGPGGPKNPGLLDVKGWESMELTVAAQKVQRSAFPNAYAKHETKARSLVAANADAPALPLVFSSSPAVSVPGIVATPSPAPSAAAPSGSSAIQYPVKQGVYRLTSKYGSRTDPVTGRVAIHGGQDFSAPLGTPIYAAADGVVAAAGPVRAGYANWVVLDHKLNGKTYSTLYAHMKLSSILVSKGATVTRGQQIASVGSEGKSTGPHLHFEVWDGGRFTGGHHIEPMAWLSNASEFVSTAGTTDCTPVGGTPNDGGGVATAATGTAAAVLASAQTQLGLPYSWGGGSLSGPATGFGQGAGVVGFDCSSLVRYAVYNGTGKSLTLPRTSREQWAATKRNQVTWENMQAGDLMFWANGGVVYHVALYLGNDRMIEAPRPGKNVHIVSASSRKRDFIGATRLNYGGAQ